MTGEFDFVWEVKGLDVRASQRNVEFWPGDMVSMQGLYQLVTAQKQRLAVMVNQLLLPNS